MRVGVQVASNSPMVEPVVFQQRSGDQGEAIDEFPAIPGWVDMG